MSIYVNVMAHCLYTSVCGLLESSESAAPQMGFLPIWRLPVEDHSSIITDVERPDVEGGHFGVPI